eukprot:1162977-Rhodomonas_salina.4
MFLGASVFAIIISHISALVQSIVTAETGPLRYLTTRTLCDARYGCSVEARPVSAYALAL